MENAYGILEFAKIKAMVAKMASTERGIALVEDLHLLPVAELREELLNEKEALDLLRRYGGFPISGSKTCRKASITRRKAGFSLPRNSSRSKKTLKPPSSSKPISRKRKGPRG